MRFEWEETLCPLEEPLPWSRAQLTSSKTWGGVGWGGLPCLTVLSSPFPVPGFPVELLPRPQRGTVQAAAQAGTTPALLAETGAAESQIAHEGRGPAKDNFLHRETPCFSDSPVIVSRGPHE